MLPAAPRIGEPVAPTRAVPVALTLLALIAIVDLWVAALSDRDAILEPLLVVGPLVAATHARPAHVGAVAGIAVLLSLVLGSVDGRVTDTTQLIALIAVAAGGALAVAVAQAHEVLAGTVREHGAQLEVERSARRRADLLARSGELLESPLDPDTMLARVTGLPVPNHADLAIVDLLQADGTLRGAVTNAVDDGLAQTLREIRERFPLDPDGPHPVAVALRSGAPQLLPRMSDERLADIAADAEHLELMRAARYRSALVLPLTARGRTFGVLSLLRFDAAPAFAEEDLDLGVDLARHAALALDNARLFHELHTTEQRLEAIVARERLLSTASKLLGSSLDVAATVDKAAWAAVPELADWARIDLVDERGALRQAAVAHRDLDQLDVLDEIRRDFPLRADDAQGPWAVLRTGEPLLVERFDTAEVDGHLHGPRHAELLARLHLRSLIIVPLRAGDRAIGTLQLATTSASGRVLGAADVEVAEELARRAAIAVEHARLHAARTHIATTLQRSLLPPRLPVVPGLTIAARFRAIGAGSEVGGDFYDLFEGRGGWVVLIGDVTGKGPVAAATTSLARYTMRTVAQYEDDPRAMLARLNATLNADPDRRQICTAACVALRDGGDRGRLRVEVVRAGHPAPLLVSADGEVRPVGRPGTLLGAFPDGEWPVDTLVLAPGETLVLYTDGVTDTRGEDDRFGTERLVEVLRALGPAEADQTAQHVDDALQAFGEQRDDVALLVLRATGLDAPPTAVVQAHGADFE